MVRYFDILSNLLGVLILSIICYTFYNFITAEQRIKQICSQINPGLSMSGLKDFSVNHGLNPPPNRESGVVFMVEYKTFGRYGCQITLENGSVKKVEYTFSD